MADITETNKEVILTESAVKQLIKNIKDADNSIKNDYIPKDTLSSAFDIMYSSAENTPARLAANTTETKKFLSMKGANNKGAAPIWSSVESGDLPFATKDAIGGVKIGDNINLTMVKNESTGEIENTGEISVNVATKRNGDTSGTLGVVSIGDNINISSNGEIFVPVATKYTTSTVDEQTVETPGTLGLVSIGDNINISKDGEISIPVATAGENGINGVVTTEAQSFNGIKKFVSGSGIYSNEQNSKLSFYRNTKESCFIKSHRYAPNDNYLKGQMSFGNYSYNNSTGELLDHAEIYNLPITQEGLEEDKTYDILTTKTSKNVSVAPPNKDNNNELPGIKLHFDSSTTATATVAGVTASNTVIVSPVASDSTTGSEGTMSSWEIWRDAGIRCTGQSTGALTFTADETLTTDTYFNVIILD